jgi:hypothetical protein
VRSTSTQAGERELTVTITQSKNGIVPVVLASLYTAQTNFISASTIYCFYLNMAYSPICLCSDLAKHIFHVQSDGPFTSQIYNQGTRARCGAVCPLQDRKTVGDKGVTSFRWNPMVNKPPASLAGTNYLLGEKVCKW